MSEPKRYDNFQYETAGGEYVLYTDYARLKAEVDRVTSQNGYAYTGLAVSMLREELAHKCHDNLEIRKAHQATVQMVRDLQADVERLRKAGDELHAFLINYIVDNRISSAYLNKLDDGWLAAKEGKPQS